MSRLTRREMKRDEVAEALGRTVEYSKSHLRTLILIVAGVLVVAVLGAFLYTWRERAVARTNERLTDAMEVWQAPVDAEAPKPDDPDAPVFATDEERRARAAERFEEVRGGAGTAADVALVYLGQLAADRGDVAAARELWQEFLDGHEDHVLAGAVRVSLIALDRAQGEAERVAADLETMIELNPEERPLPGDVVLYELGRTYQALGRDEDAGSVYQRLLEEYPLSAYAMAARAEVPAAAGSPAAGFGA